MYIHCIYNIHDIHCMSYNDIYVSVIFYSRTLNHASSNKTDAPS